MRVTPRSALRRWCSTASGAAWAGPHYFPRETAPQKTPPAGFSAVMTSPASSHRRCADERWQPFSNQPHLGSGTFGAVRVRQAGSRAAGTTEPGIVPETGDWRHKRPQHKDHSSSDRVCVRDLSGKMLHQPRDIWILLRSLHSSSSTFPGKALIVSNSCPHMKLWSSACRRLWLRNCCRWLEPAPLPSLWSDLLSDKSVACM